MKYRTRYTIGDVSKICNISKKALRYYDQIGLIPTQRLDYNNYRYYTYDTLLAVPVIKYYKQMGFKLDEMRSFIEGNVPNVYPAIQKSFLAKIVELENELETIHRQHLSVKAWYDLLLEAQMVIDNRIQEVSVKVVEAAEYLFQRQQYDGNLKASIINIQFVNYLDELNSEISGPVILNFSSYKDRIQNKNQPMRILQKNLMFTPEIARMRFGGQPMVTCYHIGLHEKLPDTYQKILRWVRQHGYELEGDCYERYVTDYWTTRNKTDFVTEVMLPVARRAARSHEADAEERLAAEDGVT